MHNNVFQFRDRNVNVNIAGHDFSFEVTAELKNALSEFAKEGAALAESLRAKEKGYPEAIEYCRRAMDSVLREGAFDMIFADRTPEIVDCADILTFLSAKVRQVSRISVPQNREQRRGKNRR